MTFVRTYRNSPAVGTDSGEEKSPSTVGYRAYATKDTPSPQEHAHERWEFLNNKTDWATVSAIASEHTNTEASYISIFLDTDILRAIITLSPSHVILHTHTHTHFIAIIRVINIRTYLSDLTIIMRCFALPCAQCRSSLASHSARTGLVRLLEFPESAGAISGQTRTGERSSPRS